MPEMGGSYLNEVVPHDPNVNGVYTNPGLEFSTIKIDCISANPHTKMEKN